MSIRRETTGWLGAVLLGLLGCSTTDTNLKPPLHEEYTLPPSDDPRFSQPISYPKESLNFNQFKKDKEKDQDGSGGPGGPKPGGMSGGGGGMRGS